MVIVKGGKDDDFSASITITNFCTVRLTDDGFPCL